MDQTPSPRIVKIESARLEGVRPRKAGCNARLGEHGSAVRPPVVRITTDDGATGFGVSRATREAAVALLGAPLDVAFSAAAGSAGASGDWVGLEYPLWDLAAKRAGKPVFRYVAGLVGRQLPDGPFRVPCYDTSLYIDDLHLTSDDEAAALIASEAREGYERGHRNFKIKVGRGARHMPMEQGTARDVRVIRAVRDAAGPQAQVMIDANNGYTLNLTKRVLDETADCRLYWIEEAFHEDAVLYQDLKHWMAARGITTLIADGEGAAHPALMEWARDHVVDVIQYDYAGTGFTRWLSIGRQLDEWGAQAAPHHYGGLYGNFASGHLAGAIGKFTFVEWDEASAPGLDGSAYRVRDGYVTLPETPGFGLSLDEPHFTRLVSEGGFALTA